MATERFSDRHGFRTNEAKIKVRYDAPAELRGVLVEMAYEFGLRPSGFRTLVCRVLRRRPDQNNWTERPNIDYEVRELVDSADWYQVYDIIEELYRYLKGVAGSRPGDGSRDLASQYAIEIDKYFRQTGIGWHMSDGELQFRGDDAFENSVLEAHSELRRRNRTTAAGELEQARNDLSRRPSADVTGAIQHSPAALECLARDVTGDSQSTLGKILQRNRIILPLSLDIAVEKLWGFASERGRHLREGREPTLAEAQLIVGLVAALCTYLSLEH